MAHIQYIVGNIFDSKAQVIVNTVNCKGVMGKGLALAFKERYPEMFPVYQQECKDGRLRIGRPTLFKESTPWILNFPTKDNWRANSKLEYIEKGLKYFVAHYKLVGINSIAFPKLGAQNGKLSWDDVGPLMAEYLGQLDIPVYIYISHGDNEYQNQDQSEATDDIQAHIWEQFNEIALSAEHLRQELQLNKNDARKIAEKRLSLIFTSIVDIEDIPGIAKISVKRIKNYNQRYKKVELAGMPEVAVVQAKESSHSYNPTHTKEKKKNMQAHQQLQENKFYSSALFY